MIVDKDTAIPTDPYARRLFHYAALWNWCAAAPFYFFLRPMLAVLGMRPPVYTIFAKLFLALVAVFGYGYYQVSRNPRGNDLVIRMGVLGKTWVFLLMLIDGLRKRIHPLFIAVGAVDFIFAVMFIQFLATTRKEDKP